jgi:hypothetical protein
MILYMHDVRVRAIVGGSAGRNDRLGRYGHSCPRRSKQLSDTLANKVAPTTGRYARDETRRQEGASTTVVFASPTPRPSRPTTIASVSKPNTIQYVCSSLLLRQSQMIEQVRLSSDVPAGVAFSISFSFHSRTTTTRTQGAIVK